jgi:hypothetical protein
MKSKIFNLIICLALVALGIVPVLAQKSKRELQPRLKVSSFRAYQKDLTFVRVVDMSNGAVFRVYFDEGSQKTAKESIQLLASFYEQLARILSVDAGEVDWSAVVFTQNKNYVPPRIGGEVRWTVRVDEAGRLGVEGLEDLYYLIPHEQVHAIQKTFVENLPRWFAEGQAEWGGLQVTERRQPKLSVKRRADLASSILKAKQPLNLQGWGGVNVKPEAILRQVTPEQRERMAKDPNYSPPGPFKFNADDFISDESNTLARYGAARNLFGSLEKSAGRAKMRALFKEVWKNEKGLKTDELVSLALNHLGTDVSASLK